MYSDEFLRERSWTGTLPSELLIHQALRIDSLLSSWAWSQPERCAILFEGSVITYGALDAMVNRAASGLIAHGVNVGDIVAVEADNSPQVVALLYGLVRAGATLLPLNPRNTPSEKDFQVADAGAKMRIGIGGLPIEQIFEQGSEDPVEINFDENLFFHVRFTGGTTGVPRCVAHTHRAIALGHERVARELRYSNKDVALVVAPLAHVSFHLAATMLAAGGAIALHRKFDGKNLWEACDRDGVTHAMLVPTMLGMALDIPKPPRTLRQIIVTSAPFPESMKVRARERLPNVEIYEIYSASDMAYVSILRPTDPPEKLGSIGRPAFGAKVRVISDEGKVCAPKEIGQIYSVSQHHTFGYVGSIKKKVDQTLPGGWLTVGDLGYFDEDGYLYIVDRRDDLIISGGFNVYPAEVENILLQHPQVSQVAVVGVKHEKWGQMVAAAVICEPGVSPVDLDKHCRTYLSDYKVPRHYEFVDTLPLTPALKIMRRVIRAELEEKILLAKT
ncbi:class I adenylate-forming enzyme family protein [Burkholderia orbicola]|uniref:class I adenylate-forming enzyme family protein n=1 Tax=Burkholderia orbicola TaxID=2978683 RepID=UPI0039A70825